MIVVDTNIIAYLYITGDKSEQVEKLLLNHSEWCAPMLWRSEFRSVLSLYLRKEILTMPEVLQIMSQAESLLKGNEYEVPSSLIMDLVASSHCSAYDCEFVALARQLDIFLVTEDKKILQEFPDIAKSLSNYIK